MMASFKPKSVVFDYFEMPDDTSGKYRAKYKQCTATVAAIGMTTSNLLIHLKVNSFVLRSGWASVNDGLTTMYLGFR